LLAAIRPIFAESRERYGAPRVHAKLAKEGVDVSRKRVARLMRENGLRAKWKRKYKHTTDSTSIARRRRAPSVAEIDTKRRSKLEKAGSACP
jgi:transposase InsO family protein